MPAEPNLELVQQSAAPNDANPRNLRNHVASVRDWAQLQTSAITFNRRLDGGKQPEWLSRTALIVRKFRLELFEHVRT